MKILVMGAGAIGSCYGGLLAKNGEDVALVARGANAEAIRGQGLYVDSATEGRFTAHPRVIEKPDGGWLPDLVLFCVKGYDNEAAMELMAPAIGPSTSILTLQNGLGGGDRLADRFGREKTLLGAAYIEAERKGPGKVAHYGSKPRIVFGEERGAASERTSVLRQTLQEAGIDAQVSDDIYRDLWSKLIFVCSLSGMCCITRSSFAEVLDDPETSALALRIMQEVYVVGRASGVDLPGDVVQSHMEHFRREKEGLVSSMYMDLLAGNRLELSVINGAVSVAGRRVGVPTPINDFITSCLSLADKRASV